MIREYAFEASNRHGQAEKSTVVAADAADAREQLTRMGYSDIRVAGEDNTLDGAPFQPDLHGPARNDHPALQAATYARHWPLLVPGAVALAAALWLGQWQLWAAGILLAGLLIAAMRIAPDWLYQQVAWAHVNGTPRRGLVSLRMLGLLNSGGRLSEMRLDYEKARLLASSGRLEQALDEYFIHADHPDHVLYLSNLAAIYGAGGAHQKMLVAQREALAASGNSDTARIDLALSLIRVTTEYEEARTLVDGVAGTARLPIVRALLLQAEGQHQAAIAGLRAAFDSMAGDSDPACVIERAELCGYIALSMKALGQRAKADALWFQAWQYLHHQHVGLLAERYEAA